MISLEITQCQQPDRCRISIASSVRQPLIEWMPLFDGYGGMINADPNTVITAYSCEFCNRSWELEQKAGNDPIWRDTSGSVAPMAKVVS